MDNDVIVEIWDDPVWTPALAALENEGDPKPLGKLLRDRLTPPLEVTERLGILLDAPEGYVGRTLTVKTPKRTRDKAIRLLSEDRKLRRRILAEFQKSGKLESAIATVQRQTGLSRSKLFEVWRLDDYETALRSQAILGYDPPQKSPPKRNKTRRL
jgi:hypothetical protein